MSDRPLHLEHRNPRPDAISVRIILPQSFEREVGALLGQDWPGAKVEIGYLEPIPATLVLTETRAGILFPGLDGQVDMNRGSRGRSRRSRGGAATCLTPSGCGRARRWVKRTS